MTRILNETLERGFSSPPKRKTKVHIKTHAVGIRPAYRGMSMNQMYDQLEAEDHLKVAEGSTGIRKRSLYANFL